MKRKYSKPIVKLIRQKMAERWPEFVTFKCPDKTIVTPLVSFRWDVPGVANIFILVIPDPQGYDSFLCDFAWSSINDYPLVSIISGYRFPNLAPEEAFSHPETVWGIEGVWGGERLNDV